MKRVAVDLRMVGRVPHGIARYALGLWNHLPERRDLTYMAIASEAGASAVGLRRQGDEVFTARASSLAPGEQMEMPRLLRKARADLLHATSFSVPRLWNGPLVVTLHDLTHLRYPELHGPGRRLYYRLVAGPAARRAAAVLTVSRFEAGEIAKRLGVAPERLSVAAPAVEVGFGGEPRPPEATPPMILYAGNGKPHKNVELIVRAHALTRVFSRLVLAGEGLEAFASPRVEVHAAVDDRALAALYRQASLFLFPSRSEGFGLPPLEAAAAGTPVLVADAAALPETWRGVAPLLSPDDPAAWAREIDRLLSDPRARAELARRCAANAALHASWEPLAGAAERAYRAALDVGLSRLADAKVARSQRDR